MNRPTYLPRDEQRAAQGDAAIRAARRRKRAIDRAHSPETTSAESATTPDVSVSGSWGLYRVHAASLRALRWLRRHLAEGERTWASVDTIVCEGGRECRALVAGMVADGLSVEVNGVDMCRYKGG